jgi:hypothetical protein
MHEELQPTVEALIKAQKHIADMTIDDRMALGEALATALRQAGMLERFELNTSRGPCWKIDTRPLVLRVDDSTLCDDDIPF